MNIWKTLFTGANMHMIFSNPPRPKGCGKSHLAVKIMWKVRQNIPEAIIFTNIVFKERQKLGNRRNFVEKWPEGIHFTCELGDMLCRASKLKLECPEKIIILFIDELPDWISKLDPGMKDNRVISKIFNISRKFPLCIVGIGPLEKDFPTSFTEMVNVWWYKDKAEAESRGMSVKEFIHLEAEPEEGVIDKIFKVGSCPWTALEDDCRPGDIIYEHLVPSCFEVDEWLYKHQKALMKALSSGIREDMARNLYDFLRKHYVKGNAPDGQEGNADSEGMPPVDAGQLALEYLLSRFIDENGKVGGRIHALVYKGEVLGRAKKEVEVSLPFLAELTGISEAKVRRTARRMKRGAAEG